MNFYTKKVNTAIDVEIKDVDTTGRTVSMYWAAFDNKDRVGDVIVKGAFKKTLLENKDELWHLLFHDPDQPVSRPTEVMEDSKGLLAHVPMPNTTRGNDTLQMYLDGHYKKQSIGYREIKTQSYPDYKELRELALREGSTVLWPANPEAVVVGVKGLMTEKEIDQEIKLTIKGLRNGKYSDDAFALLEIKLYQLMQFAKDSATTPAADEAQEPEEDKRLIAETFKSLTTLFKS